MANIVPDASDLYFDDDVRAYFEHLLPELAAQVHTYKASGPNGIVFMTGDHHHFIFSIRGEKTKDPLDLKWTLECVCWDKDDHEHFEKEES